MRSIPDSLSFVFWLEKEFIMLDPIVFAVPVFLFLIGLEIWYSIKEKLELYEFKDTVVNLAMGAGMAILGLGGKAFALFVFTQVHKFALFDIGYQWWAWLILFFADDLTYYVYHRASHEVRLFWAAHVNHHSSQLFNLTTAIRQTWVGSLYYYFFWIWLPILGFPPLMIMMMMSFNLIYQYWIHTGLVKKIGFLEYILNTPSHHRVHHAVNVNYLDRNHGGILIIWDRLFGTFAEERDSDPPVYGLTENINSYNPLYIAFHEYGSIWKDVRQPGLSFRDRWMYIFGPPGWSHDGSRLTTRELRKVDTIA